MSQSKNYDTLNENIKTQLSATSERLRDTLNKLRKMQSNKSENSDFCKELYVKKLQMNPQID